jgi:hypothetical protein
MRIEEIEQRIEARPFVPFRVIVSDGRSYEVLRPDMILLSQHYITIGVRQLRSSLVFADTVIISPLHITTLEMMSPPMEHSAN